MTMQAALVGNDGIVIASDRMMQVFAYNTNGEGTRTQSHTSKFVNEGEIVCCYAGDQVACAAANEIAKLGRLGTTNHEVRNSLVRTAVKVYESAFTKTGAMFERNCYRHVLAVYRNILWHVDIRPTVTANTVCDRIVVGVPKARLGSS
jgi:hypothetical protein